MKKYLMLIIAIFMVMSTLAVMAQNEKAYTITPRLVYNFISNSDMRDAYSSMYGLLVDFDMSKFPVGLEVGYLSSNKTTDGFRSPVDVETRVSSVPLLATYKYSINDAFYVKAGAGVAFNHLKAKEISKIEAAVSHSNNEFAWEIKAGYKFSKNWSAELGYVDYGDVLDYKDSSIAAIQLGVGYSF